jgi:transcriptional regulator with XRE-family HTH domain
MPTGTDPAADTAVDGGSASPPLTDGSPMIGTSVGLSRHRLGSELRRLRAACGLPLEDAAARLDLAPSTLSRIETGKASIRTSYLGLLLDLYQVSDADQRNALAGLARQGQRKDWWADHKGLLPARAGEYLGLETAASQVRGYAVQTLPGLLHTREYAVAACQATRPGLTADQVSALVLLLARRQELVLRGAARVDLVIEEPALRTVLGSARVMAGQLEHILDLAARGSATVRVAEHARNRTVLSQPFALLTMPAPAGPVAAWCSGLNGQITVTTRARDIGAAQAAYAALTGTALSPAASVRLIGKLARQARQAADQPDHSHAPQA